MQATITTGGVSAEVRAVRLTDRRVATAVPPGLEGLLVTRDGADLDVAVVLVDDAGHREEHEAVATVVRSGRAWTEARGRLREERGWTQRLVGAPAEVVVLTLGVPEGTAG